MDFIGIAEALTKAWDHMGAIGIGVVSLALASFFVGSVSWRILRQGSVIQTQLAETQSQLVTYVTTDSKSFQNSLHVNSNTNLQVATSVGGLGDKIELLIKKLDADPGCKILESQSVCRAAEHLKITNELLMSLNVSALKAAKEIETKDDRKEITDEATKVADQLVKTAAEAAFRVERND